MALATARHVAEGSTGWGHVCRGPRRMARGCWVEPQPTNLANRHHRLSLAAALVLVLVEWSLRSVSESAGLIGPAPGSGNCPEPSTSVEIRDDVIDHRLSAGLERQTSADLPRLPKLRLWPGHSLEGAQKSGQNLRRRARLWTRGGVIGTMSLDRAKSWWLLIGRAVAARPAHATDAAPLQKTVLRRHCTAGIVEGGAGDADSRSTPCFARQLPA